MLAMDAHEHPTQALLDMMTLRESTVHSKGCAYVLLVIFDTAAVALSNNLLIENYGCTKYPCAADNTYPAEYGRTWR